MRIRGGAGAEPLAGSSRLYLSNDPRQGSVQSARNLDHGAEFGISQSSLHKADVGRVQLGGTGQRFLGHSGSGTPPPNDVPKTAGNRFPRHS